MLKVTVVGMMTPQLVKVVDSVLQDLVPVGEHLVEDYLMAMMVLAEEEAEGGAVDSATLMEMTVHFLQEDAEVVAVEDLAEVTQIMMKVAVVLVVPEVALAVDSDHPMKMETLILVDLVALKVVVVDLENHPMMMKMVTVEVSGAEEVDSEQIGITLTP